MLTWRCCRCAVDQFEVEGWASDPHVQTVYVTWHIQMFAPRNLSKAHGIHVQRCCLWFALPRWELNPALRCDLLSLLLDQHRMGTGARTRLTQLHVIPQLLQISMSLRDRDTYWLTCPGWWYGGRHRPRSWLHFITDLLLCCTVSRLESLILTTKCVTKGMWPTLWSSLVFLFILPLKAQDPVHPPSACSCSLVLPEHSPGFCSLYSFPAITF